MDFCVAIYPLSDSFRAILSVFLKSESDVMFGLNVDVSIVFVQCDFGLMCICKQYLSQFNFTSEEEQL